MGWHIRVVGDKVGSQDSLGMQGRRAALREQVVDSMAHGGKQREQRELASRAAVVGSRMGHTDMAVMDVRREDDFLRWALEAFVWEALELEAVIGTEAGVGVVQEPLEEQEQVRQERSEAGKNLSGVSTTSTPQVVLVGV